MMNSYRFIIDSQLPSINEYINKLKSPNGKRVGAAFKKKIDELCISYIFPHKRQLMRITNKPVLIHFQWHEKAKRRDLDNVYSAKKYILDAMQKCGAIENDNYAHIRGLYDGVTYGKRDYVEVTVFTQTEYIKHFAEAEERRVNNGR